MKRIFYIIFLYSILLSELVFAQNIKEDWAVKYDMNDSNYIAGIAVSNDEYIYVLITSKLDNTDFDIVLVKYNSGGNEIWNKRYNGSANGRDWAKKIAIDNMNNIYVLGCVTEINSGEDYTVIKYDKEGNELWVSNYNGPANRKDYPYDMKLDSVGNVYITGMSAGNNSGWDIATIKFNNYGVQQWLQRYNGTYNESDIGYALALDKKGNVYITGSSAIGDKNTSIITIKYNKLGNQDWIKQYNSKTPSLDYAWGRGKDLTIDYQNNVLVTGSITQQNWDIITLKYDLSGKEIWKNVFNGKSTSGGMTDQDLPETIVTDSKGNVYVCGESGNDGKNYDYTVIKYNSLGSQEWINTINTGWAYDLVLDKNENIYVTGSLSINYEGDSWYSLFYTTKYNSEGNLIWQQKFIDPDKNRASSNNIAIDKNENIYVAGFYNLKTQSILTIKYSQNYSNNDTKIFTEAQKAYNDGNYSLVIELLKDFPETSLQYNDAIALMLNALEKLKSNETLNFVSVYGQLTNLRNINISGYIIFEDILTGTQVGKCKIGSNGYYYIILPSGKRYSYYIDASGFYPLSRIADFTSSAQGLILNDNITLVSLEEMTEQQVSIRINNIFFDFNETILKPESFFELDRLYNVLNTNSEIKVEISGHTDNVGSDEYNFKLSQSRANAVKDYLVKKGINSNRIISKGYGKINPVATNDTEEGKQLNRRVEFKILKK